MRIEEIYKTMTDYINDAQGRGENIVYYIDKMRTDLNNSEIFSEDLNKEKLENQIISTSNLLTLRHNSYTIQMLNFVRLLQKHITDEYSSVDIFLSNNGIKVKSIINILFSLLKSTANFSGNPSM